MSSFSYDSNGNLTQDDQYQYVYDAESRMVTLKNLSGTTIATYAYDGKGMRIVKVWGGGRTFSLYAGSQLVSEFEDAASSTYSSGTTPGGTVADSGATLLYHHQDQLTTRLTTDNSGNLSNEQGHYPFGEDWYSGGTADGSVERRFTTYVRDDEASNAKLHYAQARENSARLARFQTADPVRGRIVNPQRLNRYSYVMGDPVNHTDPSGRDEEELACDPHVVYSVGCAVAQGMDAVNASFCVFDPNCLGGGGAAGGGGEGGSDPNECAQFQACERAADTDYQNCVLGVRAQGEKCSNGCKYACAGFLIYGYKAYLGCIAGCKVACELMAADMEQGCNSIQRARIAICHTLYNCPYN